MVHAVVADCDAGQFFLAKWTPVEIEVVWAGDSGWERVRVVVFVLVYDGAVVA